MPSFNVLTSTYDLNFLLELGIEERFWALVVKPRKNSIFLKNGKTVILVENRKFSRSWMKKMDFLVEFVSQNLVTPSNFIEFRDS